MVLTPMVHTCSAMLQAQSDVPTGTLDEGPPWSHHSQDKATQGQDRAHCQGVMR